MTKTKDADTWTLDPSFTGEVRAVVGPDGDAVAKVYVRRKIVSERQQANGKADYAPIHGGEERAHLIAAAPKLLEQLKAWNTWAETLPGGIEQFEKFARKQDNWADAPIPAHTRAAIVKAEGR